MKEEKKGIKDHQTLALAPFVKEGWKDSTLSLETLPYSAEEIKEIEGKQLSGREATKEALIKNLRQYEVLHLATHAVVNNERDQLSFIAFSPKEKKEEFLLSLVEMVMENFEGARFDFNVTEQYRNMKEVLDRHPQVVEHAKEAISRAGLPLKAESIRGGTDGSRLSFMGLPCPNLFAGEQAIHSKLEFISVKDMQKAVETIVHLASIWEEKAD